MSAFTNPNIHRCRISAEENDKLREDLNKEKRSREKAELSLSDLQHRFVVVYYHVNLPSLTPTRIIGTSPSAKKKKKCRSATFKLKQETASRKKAECQLEAMEQQLDDLQHRFVVYLPCPPHMSLHYNTQ